MNIKYVSISIYRKLMVQYINSKKVFKQGSFPEFIIIGAQKGGTTSLYRYLNRHPQVLRAKLKELQFFTHNYHYGVNWYRACFPSKWQRELKSNSIQKNVISGEASPLYMYHPKVAERIAEMIPQVKLIALLRNPTNRAISHYYHMVRIKRENLPLPEAIAQEEKRLSDIGNKSLDNPHAPNYALATFAYVARGRYIEQLERFAQYFKKDQMLILSSERFFSDSQAQYNKVLEFLGLDNNELSRIKAENPGSYKKDNNAQIKEQLNKYFKPYNQRLYEFLGEDLGW